MRGTGPAIFWVGGSCGKTRTSGVRSAGCWRQPRGRMIRWCGNHSVIITEGVMDRSKTYIVDVTTNESMVVAESAGLYIPSCSADAKYLASSVLNGRKLRLFEFASKKWSDLASQDVGLPQWSADSKYIYFDSGTSKDLAVHRVRIADGKIERIVSLENFRRVVQPWVVDGAGAGRIAAAAARHRQPGSVRAGFRSSLEPR